MSTLRLALAQVNSTVGALGANADHLLFRARAARDRGADLVLFPEMALTGYPPEDLLLEPLFLKRTADALKALARALPRDLAVVLGVPTESSKGLRNSAVVIFGGRIRGLYHKWFLPNYGVFDEARYFVPGEEPLVFSLGGVPLGLTICEDVWKPGGPAAAAVRRGARALLNLSASPFHAGKWKLRRDVLSRKSRECRVPLFYCNLIGGQDELVYDGGSLALDAKGRVFAQAPAFEENLLLIDWTAPAGRGQPAFSLPRRSGPRSPSPSVPARPLAPMEEIHRALVLGLGDYVRKNKFSKVLVGLSGGVDSALVAALAVDALGKDNVVGVTLPSRFNAAATRADARITAENLGIAFHTVPIEKIVGRFRKALGPLFAGRAPDVTEENLQSRVRGTVLMALSNKFGWLVLTTGNKSELSTGYFTLYGDSAGGFAPIKDLPKGLVYDLCRWRNAHVGPHIPASVLTRAPTAELRKNQTDQDTLPPYPQLDAVVRGHVEGHGSLKELTAGGVPPAVARRVLRLIDLAEYKRRQAPPGVKITPRAFGRDRRMPITNGFRPWE
jgi:NAD+ synthase (glutamine-hydrolysing)